MSSGPELPVIYENPRFDKATPTLKPVIDRAVRFTGVILMEWGTLTLIEESPRYIKVATVIVAGLVLAVHESWPWLRMRDRRWYPSLMVTLIVGYLALFFYALYTEPVPKASQQPAIGETTLKPPSTPRSKQTINELLEESGLIENVIKKSGIELLQEWQSRIAQQNPERICLDIDSRSFQDMISQLADKFNAAQREIANIYDKNRIDHGEFSNIFGSSITGMGPSGFDVASQALRQYAHEINVLGEHPTCEALIKTGRIPNLYVYMDRGLEQFSNWIAQSREEVDRYRDNLRAELRSAP
jgi:hypothetical protein